MNVENAIFWLNFILALFTGQMNISQISAIESDNPRPFVETFYEWDCGDETCYVIVTQGVVRTGP